MPSRSRDTGYVILCGTIKLHPPILSSTPSSCCSCLPQLRRTLNCSIDGPPQKSLDWKSSTCPGMSCVVPFVRRYAIKAQILEKKQHLQTFCTVITTNFHKNQHAETCNILPTQFCPQSCNHSTTNPAPRHHLSSQLNLFPIHEIPQPRHKTMPQNQNPATTLLSVCHYTIATGRTSVMHDRTTTHDEFCSPHRNVVSDCRVGACLSKNVYKLLKTTKNNTSRLSAQSLLPIL